MEGETQKEMIKRRYEQVRRKPRAFKIKNLAEGRAEYAALLARKHTRPSG